ncbi:MAG: VanW family protein [bacterium]
MRAKILKFAKYAFFAVVIVVGVVFIPYHLAFAGKIIPNVWVGEINLGGKSTSAAQSLITAYLENKERGIITLSNEKDFQKLPLIELGLSYNPKETTITAYRVGRSGNIITDTKNKITAYRKGVRVKPTFTIDEQIFTSQAEKYFGEFEEKFVEASLTLKEGKVIFVPGQEGKALNLGAMLSCFANKAGQLESEPKCPVIYIVKKPQYGEQDFANIVNKVLSLEGVEVTINWAGGAETLTGAALLNLLEVEPKGLFVSLEKVTQYVGNLAQHINREPVNAAFEVKESGALAMFTPSREGIRLNEESLTENLVELLDEILKTEVRERKNYLELDAQTEIINPEISSVENEYGIKTLLGEGKSNYHGSIANRIYNINLASESLNGRLIEPGATVSFNNLLGEVSSDTGYKASFVIIGNQTILGAGGGVCQASTTMFRAVLNAGLPIINRMAHLYRVHYYEPPLGMDATVMAPYTDFVFQNDTPAYILVQTYVNNETEDVTYNIFGTSDGRQTTIGEPVVTNQTGYPATIYKEDATLEKGKTVQVEWAAGGASAMVTRQVTREGVTLQDDTFVSNYVPWPAVFLVGTK